MTLEEKIAIAAQAAHEVNRTYCAALGDLSQLSWESSPDWQRESALLGVRFLIENPNASPSASHESWLEEKRREGWVWGPEKDPIAKRHPCFMPYEQLPESQRAKDTLFGAVVRGVLAHLEQS